MLLTVTVDCNQSAKYGSCAKETAKFPRIVICPISKGAYECPYPLSISQPDKTYRVTCGLLFVGINTFGSAISSSSEEMDDDRLNILGNVAVSSAQQPCLADC